MHSWSIAGVALACITLCLCENVTEQSVSSLHSTNNATANATSPSAATVSGSPSDSVAVASATTSADGSTSAADPANPASSVATSPPSDTAASNSTTVSDEVTSTAGEEAKESSAAEDATTSAAPETTVAPSSAAETVGSSSSAAETTPGPAEATSVEESGKIATTVATSTAETTTTAGQPATTPAETDAETTTVPTSEATVTQTTRASEEAETVTTAAASETTEASETTVDAETAETAETSAVTEAPGTTASQSSSAAPGSPTASAITEATTPVATPPPTQPPSSPASSEAAGETGRAETEPIRETSPAAASTEEPISTTEEADQKTVTAPMEYYGYPRSMTEKEMGGAEAEAAVTLMLNPRRISFLAWLGMKEGLLRSAVLNITRNNGFDSSELEWVYISPSPIHRPPHILLSFVILWRGGPPVEGTVTPSATSQSVPVGGDVTRPASLTPPVTPETSDPTVTPGSRRRREAGREQSGMVPAELLMRIIMNNAEGIGNMVSADLESASAGLKASSSPCSEEEESFMTTNGQIMLALSVAAGICICLTCGALLYVRVVRDSGHWEPQPAYHEGERVGGLDLHTDTDCKKGEEPLDDNGAEVYPLSSVTNTPRGSFRGDAKV